MNGISGGDASNFEADEKGGDRAPKADDALSFSSANIKKGDDSQLFTKVAGETERKKKLAVAEAKKERNLSRAKKKFQKDLKEKQKNATKSAKKQERKQKRRAWLKKYKKILIALGIIFGVAVVAGVASLVIYNIIHPPLTAEEKQVIAEDKQKKEITTSFYEYIYSDYDFSDPNYAPEIDQDSVNKKAEEFIDSKEGDEKTDSIGNYVTLLLGAGDLIAAENQLGIMKESLNTKSQHYVYYQLSATLCEKKGDKACMLENWELAENYKVDIDQERYEQD